MEIIFYQKTSSYLGYGLDYGRTFGNNHEEK